MIALGLPAAAAAQGFRLSGRVFLPSGADTVPLVNHWVVMHQVTAQGGAAVDSSRTDRFGVYQLRAPQRDTLAIYLASVRYRGIAYFSLPVHAIGITTDTASTLFVYDTSSVEPEVTTAQRQIVVRAPESDGTHSVLELIVLRNTGTLTRIANDTTHPVWQSAIPPGAVNLQGGDGDISAAAVYRRGDSAAVMAPVEPGEKRVVFSYVLRPTGSRLSFPIDQAVGRLQVLIEDTTATVEEGPVAYLGVEAVQRLRLANFEGVTVPTGSTVVFRLSKPGFAVGRLAPFVLILAALALLWGFWWWWRRGAPVAAVAGDDPDVLAGQIALLDEAFEARGADATEAERAAHAERRADLKNQLLAALARRGPQR